jgi:single-strand DNA-binding protein
MSINKVFLLGNLGKDPELRYTAQQNPVCSFSIATSDRRKENGNWVDHTEWHNVVVFGKAAENCAQYLKKGRQAFIEGRITTRKWQDKEGRDRYTTEVIAFSVQFVGGAGKGAPRETMLEGSDEGSAASAGGYGTSTGAGVAAAAAGSSIVDSLPSADAIAGGGAGLGDDDIPF